MPMIAEGVQLETRLLPSTRYVAIPGMEGSNNRRQALTTAVITAALLNRTLLVCDPPLLELYDDVAIRARVPVQATFRCKRWEPRPRSRFPACVATPACNPRRWTKIPSLGGPGRVDPFELIATYGGSAAERRRQQPQRRRRRRRQLADSASSLSHAQVLVADDYWGVPWWNFRVSGGSDAAKAMRRRLADLHQAVRYAPSVFRAAEDIVRVLEQQGQLRAESGPPDSDSKQQEEEEEEERRQEKFGVPGRRRVFHSVHLRVGDRAPHPLVPCEAFNAADAADAKAVCASSRPSNDQGACTRRRRRNGSGGGGGGGGGGGRAASSSSSVGAVTFADALRRAVSAGAVARGDVVFVAASSHSAPAVKEFMRQLLGAGSGGGNGDGGDRSSFGELGLKPMTAASAAAAGGLLPLPATVPSCVAHPSEARPCLPREFDFASAVEQVVAGSASGVLIPSFPSTWDEHAIDLQCWAAAAARGSSHDGGGSRGALVAASPPFASSSSSAPSSSLSSLSSSSSSLPPPCASFLLTDEGALEEPAERGRASSNRSSDRRQPEAPGGLGHEDRATVPFTAAWNKRNFIRKVRSYCGVF